MTAVSNFETPYLPAVSCWRSVQLETSTVKTVWPPIRVRSVESILYGETAAPINGSKIAPHQQASLGSSFVSEIGRHNLRFFWIYFLRGIELTTPYYIPYTPPVALRPVWPRWLIREVFRPRNIERRNGGKKNGRNGAPAPQSRVSLSAIERDGVHSSG